MNNFGRVLESILEKFDDRTLDQMGDGFYRNLTVQPYFFGGKIPRKIFNQELLDAAARQQKIHRERKEREKKR